MVHTKEVKKGKLVVKSGFSGYDLCLNPYVGCAHGCDYCYVRFFIKDKEHPWGEFLRLRKHIATKLPCELTQNKGKRLVMGTMSDPYQPAEEKELLTQTAIKTILAQPVLSKVGIFTKSTLILRDQALIEQLPDPHIHITLSPYPDDTIKLLERDTKGLEDRIQILKSFKDGGKTKINVNIAPLIPTISDDIVIEILAKLLSLNIDQFFIDPMQVYTQSMEAVNEKMVNYPGWKAISDVMMDAGKYSAWKKSIEERYTKFVNDYKDQVPGNTTRAIWSDHVNKVWRDMRTGLDVNRKE